ncbi:glycosyltransferase [Rhodococcus sp. 14C212]|uniref:glycosyltransferase n=1 Tax=Rhodococcus sp. 14C212 TaxID=2711209 RepID=UPI0013E9E4CE|nr:glycosyltransferase [Rhodococcus sp. 14C212]NGP07716.1 glycosyltransferase [Rhodococcus sp. 14C212]
MERVDLRPGGLNRYFHHYVAALQKQAVEVKVVQWTDSEAEATLLPVRSLYSRLWYYFIIGLRDRNVIVDSHFALYGAAYIFGRILSGSTFELVTHFHGPWAAESAIAVRKLGLANRAKFFVEKIAYAKTSHFIVLSTCFRDVLVNSYGVPLSRISVVSPGVDLDRFVLSGTVPLPRPRDEGPFRVFAARRLDPRMGLDIAIRAIAQLPDHVTLCIVGEGRERPALKELISELGVGNRVELLGRVPDDVLVELYQSSDVSLVPTRALEGFGLVVLESLACGTPVIASREGGLIDALESLRADLLVTPEDPKVLGDRIQSAIDGAVPSREECRAYAESFSWTNVAARHRAIFGFDCQSSGIAGERPALRTVAVAIPSVGRPDELARCLDALTQQIAPAAEVLIVAQGHDNATIETARRFESVLPIRVCIVSREGLAAAIECAFEASSCEITAFTDDDAVPHSDWILRLSEVFRARPDSGAVGGRDLLYATSEEGAESNVGRIERTGRISGNHAVGRGSLRSVDHLKGVNMAVATAIGRKVPLGSVVCGKGAQYRNELFLGLAVRRLGFEVYYDPSIRVDHYPSIRPGGDMRDAVSDKRIRQDVDNQTTALTLYGASWVRVVAIVRSVLIGTRNHPGLVVALLDRSSSDGGALLKLRATMLGACSGLWRGLKLRDTRWK